MGLTEFSEAPQQCWQKSVPAGLSFLQTGQINHRPSGGCGKAGFCPSSETGAVINKYFL
jgi:hypothetical protein